MVAICIACLNMIFLELVGSVSAARKDANAPLRIVARSVYGLRIDSMVWRSFNPVEHLASRRRSDPLSEDSAPAPIAATMGIGLGIDSFRRRGKGEMDAFNCVLMVFRLLCLIVVIFE